MPVSRIQVALVGSLLCGIGFVWYAVGRGRWRRRFDDRFIHGVPWGTLVTVGIVVGFYLLAQGGLRDWSDPVVLPYVTWSHFYPTGLLTAGVAHGSAEHLVSNVVATLVLAPIAEYAWSHYPISRERRGESSAAETTESATAAESNEYLPAVPATGTRGDADPITDGGVDRRPLTRPWFRALVVFPGALLGLALFTAVFSMGPGLGFSGVVYAIGGFAVAFYPVKAVIGIVATAGLGTLYEAFTEPVIRETIDAGAPGPPGWAGIGFQAHALGFLVGVLLAIVVLRHRGRRPCFERVFFATLLFGLVQSLWLIAWPGGDDTYYLYQGIGVTLVLLLTVVVSVAAAGSDRPLLGPVRDPLARLLAVGWLSLVSLVSVVGIAGVVIGDEPALLVPLILLTGLLALPGVPPLVSDRWARAEISPRGLAVTCLLVVTVVVALPSIPVGMLVVEDGTVPGSGEVAVEEYAITYERDVPIGSTFVGGPEDDDVDEPESTVSGVIVVSPDRDVWTVWVEEYELEHEGDATVEVGSIGWQETVHAERSGWDVVGNETAYAVDLTVGEETTRSFESDPVRAATTVDGHEIAVSPDTDAFQLAVTTNGSTVGTDSIPAVGEETTIGDLRFTTETVDGNERVFVEANDTRAQIAERETYD